MVISLYATAPYIERLPRNFYSLGIPDQITTKAIIQFIHQRYPSRAIFIASESDSKEARGMAELLKHNFHQQYPQTSITISYFLKDEVQTMDLSHFLSEYKKGSIIIILDHVYYNNLSLMRRIAQYSKNSNTIFITAVDNWGQKDRSRIFGFPHSVEAYRVSPWVMNETAPGFRSFNETYKALYDNSPTEMVSLTVYQAITSIVSALQVCPNPNHDTSMRERILLCYQYATNKDKFWFRPHTNFIYRIEASGERLIGTITETDR